jgi:hypothetical protein
MVDYEHQILLCKLHAYILIISLAHYDNLQSVLLCKFSRNEHSSGGLLRASMHKFTICPMNLVDCPLKRNMVMQDVEF